MYFEKAKVARAHCVVIYRVRSGTLPPMNARIAKAGKMLGYVALAVATGKWTAYNDVDCTENVSGDRKTRAEAAAALRYAVPTTVPPRVKDATGRKWMVRVLNHQGERMPDGPSYGIPVVSEWMAFDDALATFGHWKEMEGRVIRHQGRMIGVDRVVMEPAPTEGVQS